jgi:hypothetical protein
VRRRLILVSAATTSMVVLAFVVPLGAVVNGVADSRVRDSAERNAQSLANVLGVILASG